MNTALRLPALRLIGAGLLVAAGLQAFPAHAWSLSLAAASRRVFLHVGNGTANGNNGTINLVTATLTGAQLLAGTPQAMTSNSTQSGSLYGDGYTTCPTPSTQVIVGASYRRSNAANGPASATLRVTSPASLTTDAGDEDTAGFGEGCGCRFGQVGKLIRAQHQGATPPRRSAVHGDDARAEA